MTPQYSSSAALLFTEQELGGPCYEVEHYDNFAPTTPRSFVQGNGDRVGLIMMNIGSVDVKIGINPAAANTKGIILTANGGIATLTVRDDFTLPTREWFWTTTGGSGNMYVLEIIRFTSNTLGSPNAG